MTIFILASFLFLCKNELMTCMKGNKLKNKTGKMNPKPSGFPLLH